MIMQDLSYFITKLTTYVRLLVSITIFFTYIESETIPANLFTNYKFLFWRIGWIFAKSFDNNRYKYNLNNLE